MSDFPASRAKAFAFLAQEKWTGAREEAVAAYQLRPNEPEALRAFARFLSRTRQSQALELWDQLAKNQPLTRDDLRDEATSALVAGEPANRCYDLFLWAPMLCSKYALDISASGVVRSTFHWLDHGSAGNNLDSYDSHHCVVSDFLHFHSAACGPFNEVIQLVGTAYRMGERDWQDDRNTRFSRTCSWTSLH